MTDREYSRRRLLAAAAAVGAVGTAGCVTTSLSVRAPDVAASPVFESFEVTDVVSLAGRRVHVRVTLAPDATARRGVASLSLVSGGESYWTETLAVGQTRDTLEAPIGTRTTLFAVDSGGSVVDRQPLVVVGTRYP